MAKDSKPRPKIEDLQSELGLFGSLKIVLSTIKTFHYRLNLSASTTKIDKLKISKLIF
jgi:hypothetical protein